MFVRSRLFDFFRGSKKQTVTPKAEKNDGMSRRDFIKGGVGALAGLALPTLYGCSATAPRRPLMAAAYDVPGTPSPAVLKMAETMQVQENNIIKYKNELPVLVRVTEVLEASLSGNGSFNAFVAGEDVGYASEGFNPAQKGMVFVKRAHGNTYAFGMDFWFENGAEIHARGTEEHDPSGAGKCKITSFWAESISRDGQVFSSSVPDETSPLVKTIVASIERTASAVAARAKEGRGYENSGAGANGITEGVEDILKTVVNGPLNAVERTVKGAVYKYLLGGPGF